MKQKPAAPLDRLWHLQEVLLEIRAKTEKRDQTPDHLRHVEAEHADEARRGEELTASLTAREDRRQELADEVATVGETRRRYQEQQRLVKTNREYGALLDQIDTTAREIRTREDETLALDEEIDRLKAELAAWESDFTPRRARYDEQMAGWRAEQAELTGQIAEAEARVAALRKSVDRRNMGVFDRIAAARGGVAVSKVVAGQGHLAICSGCNLRLRAQLFSDLRLSREIVRCEGCKRILYWDPADIVP